MCPNCDSKRVDKRNYATKAGAGVGAAAGGVAGYNVGAGAGAAASTVLGTLAGGTTGTAVGGAAVDKFVLNNYECLAYGHTFSE